MIAPPHTADVASVLPCSDGDVLVIPHVLPVRIPAAALKLTLGEWLGIPAEGTACAS